MASRPQRWERAIDRARQDAMDAADGAVSDLLELQQEYQDWRNALPENMECTPTAEKLDDVCDLELGFLDLHELADVLDDAEQIDLPRGFGRD